MVESSGSIGTRTNAVVQVGVATALVALMLLIGASFEQNAYGGILWVIVDEDTCETPFPGGIWDGSTNTCTLPSLTIDTDDLEIGSGVTAVLPTGNNIEVSEGATLSVASGANFDINGSVFNLGGITNSGMVNVLNSEDGSIGITNANAILTNTVSGIITLGTTGDDSYGIYHYSGGTIINSGNINVQISGDRSAGIFIQGTVDNSGTIVLQNSGDSVGISLYGATIDNSGTITIENIGFESTGIYDEEFSTINNYGTISVLNSGSDSTGYFSTGDALNNFQTITIMNSGSDSTGLYIVVPFDNSGTITIENSGDGSVGIYNHGLLDNSGTVVVEDTGNNSFGILNDHTITNYAQILIKSGGEIQNNWVIDNTNGDIIQECNGTYSGTAPVGNAIVVEPCDNAPPTTIASLSGTLGNNGWYLSDVEVTLSATDNQGGSGVASTEYSFDNATWNPYSVPFTISTEGTTTIYFMSVDNQGNVETTQSLSVMIDKTAPEIEVLGANPETVFLNLPYVDAGADVTDNLDPSPSLTTDNPVDTLIANTYIVTYTAEDEAGNIRTATRTVNVISPLQATQDLIDKIKGEVSDKNVRSSLIGPLKQIQKILSDPNPSNDTSACGKLDEFIANVNSKEASGKLDSTLAQQYRNTANAIKQSIGC